MENKRERKIPFPGIIFGEARSFAHLDGRFLFLTAVITLFLTGAACTTVFFVFVSRPEQMMVPDLAGKELTDALLEMQVKELYPRIQLRFSDSPSDKGRVLEQNPSPGSIVKAGRRITLVVSRGVLIDTLENFVGQNFDAVQARLQTVFSGVAHPTVTFAQPSYVANPVSAGTILAQEPGAGTQVFAPVQVRLVVSRGPEVEAATVPRLGGLSIAEALRSMQGSRIVFDWTSRPASGNDLPGTVVWQEATASELPVGTHVQATIVLPNRPVNNTVYGILQAAAPTFPYPVPVVLRARSSSRQDTVLTSFEHTGGNISVPYGVSVQTELTLVVAGSVVTREIVRAE
ncbi:MAG: PASTA domain-containing protein [Spirochaetaceae bacterium]|jgi:beta-lactam-binding protein with PASTA domain|nr:PASTA domain-containing protein [Spirochaetaceae bacterium]